jgi:hypothetical protein
VRLLLPDPPQKNDALFIMGAHAPKPYVFSYAQERVEAVHGPSCRKEKTRAPHGFFPESTTP